MDWFFVILPSQPPSGAVHLSCRRRLLLQQIDLQIGERDFDALVLVDVSVLR
jgi:hypothetical protein